MPTRNRTMGLADTLLLSAGLLAIAPAATAAVVELSADLTVIEAPNMPVPLPGVFPPELPEGTTGSITIRYDSSSLETVVRNPLDLTPGQEARTNAQGEASFSSGQLINGPFDVVYADDRLAAYPLSGTALPILVTVDGLTFRAAAPDGQFAGPVPAGYRFDSLYLSLYDVDGALFDTFPPIDYLPRVSDFDKAYGVLNLVPDANGGSGGFIWAIDLAVTITSVNVTTVPLPAAALLFPGALAVLLLPGLTGRTGSRTRRNQRAFASR